jgi:3'(2'), 5'-bisphosphate nucleotidase
VPATARDAGELVVSVHRSDFSSGSQDDASPVSEADERADALIVSTLRTLTPLTPIVASPLRTAGFICRPLLYIESIRVPCPFH